MKLPNENALAALESIRRSASIKERIKRHHIETPSWAYGNSGTRFKVFPQEGAPRNPFEKMEDAAVVHQFTGAAPTVAIHIPWDKVDDFAALNAYAKQLGVRVGAINPNLFQDDDYKLGSLTHESARVRKKALDHLLECIQIATAVNSDILSLWFADGTNYPGRRLPPPKAWMREGLRRADACPRHAHARQYQFFGRRFYHADISTGACLAFCKRLGDQARSSSISDTMRSAQHRTHRRVSHRRT